MRNAPRYSNIIPLQDLKLLNNPFLLSIVLTLIAGNQAFSASTDPSVPEKKAQKILEQTLSKELLTQIEKAGFKATLTLKPPNSDGKTQKYIVHIGQMHQLPIWNGRMFYSKIGREAQGYQKKLSQFLVHLVERSGSPVFREGYTFDKLITPEYASEMNKRLNNNINDINKIKKQRSIEISNISHLMTVFINASGNKEYFKYHPRYNEFTELLHKTVSNTKKLIGALKENDKQQGQLPPELLELEDLISLIEMQFLTGNIARKGYFYYAVSDAFWKGKISTLGAEDSSTNNAAIKALDIFTEAKRELDLLKMKKRKNQLTEEEQKKYSHLQKTIETAKFLMEAKRELVVYEKVKNFLQNPEYQSIVNKIKFIPVVYGVAHDFAQSAKQWNTQSKDIKFGIIKIHPLQDKKNDNNN